ncbi:peptidoglycan editing factor PgeF [Verticiella sediminum]|uniref:Purine nucleoside phosphorylase n=2 Tax=Verticiella sediminum TaxID=1247510 RepID=A0A556AD32_9BURK|nr:peptidoglycan editing factor PgeF [Verticiella sediminum]
MSGWRALGAVAGPAWAGMTIVTTTRAGGVSLAPYDSLNLGTHVGDDALAVATNRARLRALLPAEPCWLEQVHGTTVHDADGASGAKGGALPIADGAFTTTPGRVLAIMTADCLPVVIADGEARVLAMAHAGWRGLAGGVLQAAVARVRGQGGAALRAWVGPAIGPRAFEVGPDVPEAFAGSGLSTAFIPHPEHAGKWLGDLPAIAGAMLRRAGVGTVVQSGLCTLEDARFYSYRRDGRTGRFATLAWLHEPA